MNGNKGPSKIEENKKYNEEIKEQEKKDGELKQKPAQSKKNSSVVNKELNALKEEQGRKEEKKQERGQEKGQEKGQKEKLEENKEKGNEKEKEREKTTQKSEMAIKTLKKGLKIFGESTKKVIKYTSKKIGEGIKYGAEFSKQKYLELKKHIEETKGLQEHQLRKNVYQTPENTNITNTVATKVASENYTPNKENNRNESDFEDFSILEEGSEFEADPLKINEIDNTNNMAKEKFQEKPQDSEDEGHEKIDIEEYYQESQIGPDLGFKNGIHEENETKGHGHHGFKNETDHNPDDIKSVVDPSTLTTSPNKINKNFISQEEKSALEFIRSISQADEGGYSLTSDHNYGNNKEDMSGDQSGVIFHKSKSLRITCVFRDTRFIFWRNTIFDIYSRLNPQETKLSKLTIVMKARMNTIINRALTNIELIVSEYKTKILNDPHIDGNIHEFKEFEEFLKELIEIRKNINQEIYKTL
ncbi:MAG: hypothetical protein ACTSU2_11500 [Promethearchaeota archaeon]